MTIAELKSILPTMVVWMAKEAVMEGVRAYHKAEIEYNVQMQKQQSGEPYNFLLAHAYKDGVNIAAEVLWKLFESYSIQCQQAIAVVAKDRDGYYGLHESYFDDFVNALEQVQGHPVLIRVNE